MREYRVWLDGVAVEIENQREVVIGYDAEATRSVEAASKAESLDLEVVNCGVLGAETFGGEGFLHAEQRFNSQSHTAKIIYEGVELMVGEAVLLSVERIGEGAVRFRVRVTRDGAAWCDEASTMIHQLPIDYSFALREDSIREQWGDASSPVQFFPVCRDDYEGEQSSSTVGVVQRLRSIDDYHPFLHIRSMMEAMAEQGGFTISSSLMESELFGRLYMSGQYISQRNDVAAARMNFCVKKVSSESTTGDMIGRVSVGSYIGYSNLETLVDIESLASDAECYSTGGYLTAEGGIVRFTPPTSVSVGFEYRMRYTTGYRIKSRDRLAGFDSFYMGESPAIEIELRNTFVDRRGGNLSTSFEFLAVLFGESASDSSRSYRLTALINGASVESTLVEWVGGRTKRFTTPLVNYIGEATLWVNDGSGYVEYSDDWALYEGFVEEEDGQIEVDVTLRSAPTTISPSSPRIFDSIYFSGGEYGMPFTLLEGTTITPYFAAYPGYGTVVSFEDVAQHEISQGRFWESIAHLFNLRYYSDPLAKVIYLDPLEELYNTTLCDWSSRVVEGEGFTYRDLAQGIYATRRWGYQPGDGLTNRASGFYVALGENYPPAPDADPEQNDSEASSPEYGSWQRSIESVAATKGSRSVLNPIFSPSQNDLDGLLVVGDRDDLTTAGTLEFSPRVVYWMGDYTLDNETLPRVVYHSDEAEVTLCFEDRDGLDGLNRYYSAEIEREQRGQSVTATVRLTPHEMVSLLSPVDGQASVLSRFRLLLDGESVECRIESIEEYRASEGVARVKFVMLKE